MEAIIVAEASQTGEARRSAMALAKRLGFTETGVGRVGIVATELAGNILKHAGAGELLIGAYEDETGAGLECLALDKGPGMVNVAACLEDGLGLSSWPGHRWAATVCACAPALRADSWPAVAVQSWAFSMPGPGPRSAQSPASPRGSARCA